MVFEYLNLYLKYKMLWGLLSLLNPKQSDTVGPSQRFGVLSSIFLFHNVQLWIEENQRCLGKGIERITNTKLQAQNKKFRDTGEKAICSMHSVYERQELNLEQIWESWVTWVINFLLQTTSQVRLKCTGKSTKWPQKKETSFFPRPLKYDIIVYRLYSSLSGSLHITIEY